MRTLVLKNSEWNRGCSDPTKVIVCSALLLGNGQRCCLGIDAKARGIPDNQIQNIGFPFQITADTPLVAEYKAAWTDEDGDTSFDEDRIAEINDDPHLSDEMRIELLRPYFEARGIEIVFDPRG